jgi:dinuclear metal center YbgI/SA1388 family protein
MKANTLIKYLESIAPPMYQESYDNSGLLVGDREAEVSGAIISLDVTESVLEEAKAAGINMVISHHPIIFSGLKSLTGQNYVERIVMKAVKDDILLYAIHTNMDNVLDSGVNEKIAQKLGIEKIRILRPKSTTVQCQISCSSLLLDNVYEKLSVLRIGIKEVVTDLGYMVICTVPEHKLSDLRLICAEYHLDMVVVPTKNRTAEIGSGIIGEFDLPLTEDLFLARVKEKMQTPCIRHTDLLGKSIGKVALCGGSGSFLLEDAVRAGADAFITADYKYHQFFDADQRILILDIGHYESEQYTSEALQQLIREKFPNFAARCTKVYTNPVKYYL